MFLIDKKGNIGSWYVKLKCFYVVVMQECYDIILLDKNIIDIKNIFCLLNLIGIFIIDYIFIVFNLKEILMC